MKHTTLLSACALSLASLSVQAQTTTHRFAHTASPIAIMKAQVNKSLKQQGIKAQNTAQAKRAAAVKLAAVVRAAKQAGHLFKPQHQVAYWLDEETQEYEIMGEYTNTYDANGNLAVQLYDEDGTITRTTYTYDAQGNVTLLTDEVSEDGGETYTPSDKREQTFDNIVPGLVITKDRYSWNDGAWAETGDAYKRTIKRDADNNVLSCVVSSPVTAGGQFYDLNSVTNTFDAETKQADTYKYEELNENSEWETSEILKDMSWHKTNGQLVSSYSDWMSWGNQLEGALIYNAESDGSESLNGQILIEYDDKGGYTETMDYSVAFPGLDIATLTYTDDNGSYVYEAKFYQADKQTGEFTDDNLKEHSKSVVNIDDHGNVVLEENSQLNDEGTALEVIDGTKYDYTYDADTDAEKELIASQYDYDSATYVPFIKLVTDAYTDITGINQVTKGAAANDAPAQIYNLQGIRTNATTGKGVYIIRQGNTVRKVIK